MPCSESNRRRAAARYSKCRDHRLRPRRSNTVGSAPRCGSERTQAQPRNRPPRSTARHDRRHPRRRTSISEHCRRARRGTRSLAHPCRRRRRTQAFRPLRLRRNDRHCRDARRQIRHPGYLQSERLKRPLHRRSTHQTTPPRHPAIGRARPRLATELCWTERSRMPAARPADNRRARPRTAGSRSKRRHPSWESPHPA